MYNAPIFYSATPISFNGLLKLQLHSASWELFLAVLFGFHSWYNIFKCLNWGMREIITVANLQLLRPLPHAPHGCWEHHGNSSNRRLDDTNEKKMHIYFKMWYQGKLKLSSKFSSWFGFEYQIVWRLFSLCKLTSHLPGFSLYTVAAIETKAQRTVSNSLWCALLSKGTGGKCCVFFLN